MKKIRKFLLCFLLIFNLFSLTVFAGEEEGPLKPIQNIEEKSTADLLIESTDLGSGVAGTNSYYGSMEMTSDMVLEMVTHNKNNSHIYTGMENDGKTSHPIMTGTHTTQAVLDAGVSQATIDAYMEANNLVDINGAWKDIKTGETVFYIDLKKLIGDKKADEIKKEIRNSAGSRPQVTRRPPDRDGEWILYSETRTTLMDYSASGSGEYLANKAKEHYFKGIQTISESYSWGGSYPGGSCQSIFSASGRCPSDDHQSRPEWVKMSVTYRATWCQIMRYNYHKWVEEYTYETYNEDTDSYDEHVVPAHWEDRYPGWIYICLGYPSGSSTVSWAADLKEPEYTEKKAIDLTTEGPTSVEYNRANTYGFQIDLPNAVSGEAVGTVTDKSNREAGEMFTLTANNNPVGFTIDLGQTWFGVSGDNNLELNRGMEQFENHYQYVPWLNFYCGADMDNYIRNPYKISSLAFGGSFGNPKDEYTNTAVMSADEGFTGEIESYVRNIQENEPGDYYKLGADGNNMWISIFEKDRYNLKGVDWTGHVGPYATDVSASLGATNYNPFIIYHIYLQPVLYGEYDSFNAAGR